MFSKVKKSGRLFGKKQEEGTVIKKIVEFLRPFEFIDAEFEKSLGKREKRNTETFVNGNYYEGEWIVNTDIREGRGKFYDFKKK